MNCKSAQSELALLAGGDLDAAAEQEVRRHLAVCPECRRVAAELASATRTLHSLPAVALPELRLWERMQADLPVAGRAAQAPATAAGWFPVAGLIAASVAIVLFSRDTPVFHFDSRDSAAVTHATGAPPFASRRYPLVEPVNQQEWIPVYPDSQWSPRTEPHLVEGPRPVFEFAIPDRSH